MELEQRISPSTMQSVLTWIDARALQIMLGLYFLVGLAFVFLSNTVRDEGFYLYAGRLVYEGKIPYRDLPYFQMPLLPYVYGLPQVMFGPSVLVGRLTSFALSLVTVGVGVRLARRIAGRGAALLFLAFTMVDLPVMWGYATTRTESLVTPLVMLSLLFLLRERKSTMDLVLAPSLMLWAGAVRLTVIPAFVGVLVFSLYQARKNSRQWDSILVLVGLQVVVLIVVPLLLAGEKMVFNVWTAQEFRGAQFWDVPLPLGVQLRDKALFFITFFQGYPVVAVLTLVVGFFLALLWRSGWRPSMGQIGEYPTANLVMLTLAALVFLPNLFLNVIGIPYFVPASAILAVMAATATAKLGGYCSTRPEAVVVPSLLAALLLLGGLGVARDFPSTIDTVSPAWLELRQVGGYLRSVVPPDKHIVAFDTSLAVEANRKVASGLEMADVSYWPALRTKEARRYGVVNYELLNEVAADGNCGALVLANWDLYLIGRSLPPDQRPPGPQEVLGTPDDKALWLLPGAQGKYRLAKTYNSFGQWNDTLYIYVRNE